MQKNKAIIKKINIESNNGNPNVFLPGLKWTFINNVNFFKGDNYSTNTLEELKYIDNNKYQIQGEEITGGYNFSVEFEFEVSTICTLMQPGGACQRERLPLRDA